MKKLLFTIILLLPLSSYAQTFDLVRSLQTSDANDPPFVRLNDTAGESNFTHFGTMIIENGVTTSVVTINSISCIGDVCVKEDKPRELTGLIDNGKTAILRDDDELLGTIQFSILDTSPNIILMKTNTNGTVEITEWAPRQ